LIRLCPGLVYHAGLDRAASGVSRGQTWKVARPPTRDGTASAIRYCSEAGILRVGGLCFWKKLGRAACSCAALVGGGRGRAFPAYRRLPSLLYRGFPNPPTIRQPDAPDFWTACRLGNRRYGRLGNLRYDPNGHPSFSRAGNSPLGDLCSWKKLGRAVAFPCVCAGIPLLHPFFIAQRRGERREGPAEWVGGSLNLIPW
jgi:hypothetical protein